MSRRSTRDSVALGARLRELRRARGLSQVEVARRMGGSSRVVSRLEKGEMVRPGLALVSGFLRAAGASLADIADPAARGARSEGKSTGKPAGTRNKPARTTAERVRAVERRARRLYVARMFEGLLYELFTSGAVAVTDDERGRLARHAREVFRLLEKHERARDKRRRAAGADPEPVALVERFAERVFEQMWRSGDFERRPGVDAAAVVAGKAYLGRVWRVEDRLSREAGQVFVAWGRERNRLFQRIWEQGMDLLRGRGVKGQRLSRLSAVISELCGLAAESEPGSLERRQRRRELGRRMKDPKLARDMCELVFGRWDEIKDQVPQAPGERPAGGGE